MSDNVIVIATRNQGKVREFASMFEPRGFAVKSLADFTGLPDIVEDGDSFAANAVIKACTIAVALSVSVLADDSGLCVDALSGVPGVYSARYAGEGARDADNNAKLLRELARAVGEPKPELGHPLALSRGQFVCALAVCTPGQAEAIVAEGECEGIMIGEPKGMNGFGYDPLFFVPAFGRTFAELTTEEKNGISHRAKALRLLLDKMRI